MTNETIPVSDCTEKNISTQIIAYHPTKTVKNISQELQMTQM